MSTPTWVGYGAFAAVSTMLGIVLTAAVMLPGPLLVVAGSVGSAAAAAAARRRPAGAIVRAAAALSAVGLACGWLLWLVWKVGLW
jgi:pimeloyl-ACP methyl ester carboxylesterase